MHEKLVIVSEKKKLWKRILTVALFVVTCVFFLLALMAPVFFSIITVLFAVLWYFMAFQTGIEYEYTYYDGEMRFSKIIAKRKRKGIAMVQMDDVIAFAPKGDRSLYQYENNPQVKTRDLSSGKKDAKLYVLVAKTEEDYQMTIFEPDEQYLDAVCIKYRQKVIR